MDGAKFGRRVHEFRQLLSVKTYLSAFRKVINGVSIYTDLPRKSKGERIRDNLVWLLKHGEVNRYYNTYGLDIKGFRKASDFMPYRKFAIQRNDTNLKNCDGSDYNGYNRICILRDKVVFASFIRDVLGEQYAVPVLAVTSRGRASVYPGQTASTEAYLKTLVGRKTILKKISGECGDGVYLFEIDAAGNIKVNHQETTMEDFAKTIYGAAYIVQDFVEQHEALNQVNPSCVNTIRYVTILDSHHQAQTFAHFLRVGTGGTVKDNRATGGYAVNITEDGVLCELAIGHNDAIKVHPDTGLVFKGHPLPYWKEVQDLVKRAHEQFPDIKSIGWDVAITPNGPLLIEGNDNWELGGPQDMEGGLKERWKRMMKA